MAIKVLLADDHQVVRHGLKKLFEEDEDFVIVGEGSNGREILDLLKSGVQAEVLLTDLSMPVMDGIELARVVQETYPALKIVLLTVQEEEAHIQRAFEAGIRSYVFKTADPKEVLYAVRQIAENKPYLCSALSAQLIDRIATWSKKASLPASGVDFSERELDVLRLIAEGYTNEEAADKLFTSRRTVEGHRQSMIDKTGSRNSLALIAFALRHGLLA